MDHLGHQSTLPSNQLPILDLRDLSTGVHLCLLLNEFTDGKFKTGKINKNAKSEFECLRNLKIFDEGLVAFDIKEKFDVRCGDNIDFGHPEEKLPHFALSWPEVLQNVQRKQEELRV
jgi:hypothetical protein